MYKTRRTAPRSILRTSVVFLRIRGTQLVKCVRTFDPRSLPVDFIRFSSAVHPKFGQKRSEPGSAPSSAHHSQQAVIPAGFQPSHPNHMSHPHASSYKSPNNLQSSSNSRSNEQSFAAALRSLAKQQIDVKDEDMIQQGGEGKNSSSNPRASEKEHEANRQSSASRGIQYDNRSTDMRNLTSPQPPDKKVSVVQGMR